MNEYLTILLFLIGFGIIPIIIEAFLISISLFIEVNPYEEALSLLKSIKVDNSILYEFEEKVEITKKDLKKIELIIEQMNPEEKMNFNFQQKFSLAKIKSRVHFKAFRNYIILID